MQYRRNGVFTPVNDRSHQRKVREGLLPAVDEGLRRTPVGPGAPEKISIW